MDGGGRVSEPLNAGPSGAAFARQPRGRFTLSDLPRRLFLTWPARLPGFGRKGRSSVAVPFATRLPRLTGTGLTLALFAGIGAYGLVANGSYAAYRDANGDPRDTVARALGFGLQKITISGLVRLPEIEILRLAGITPRSSLPFLGAAEMRERLQANPFIRSVEIRKLYPNQLAITLVEREPYALWQRNGELFVVGQDGTVIDRLRDPTLVRLPLVVGDLANERAARYVALLEAAGPLRAKIRAGMLVSGRRWNLKMENGLDVRLPEDGAAGAMARLVRLDREAGLLDKDVLAIDLRMPDRIVLRLTEEAAAARADLVKKKLQRGVKGVET